MTPEGKVKSAIKKYLDSLGKECWYFSPMMNGYGRKGIPDLVGFYKGQPFVIEVKAPGKIDNVTEWQRKELQAAYHAGAWTFLVDDVGSVRAVFEPA